MARQAGARPEPLAGRTSRRGWSSGDAEVSAPASPAHAIGVDDLPPVVNIIRDISPKFGADVLLPDTMPIPLGAMPSE